MDNTSVIKELSYNDLTNFLLNIVRLRPAMYLGYAKISLLPTFVMGYMFGYGVAKADDALMDEYFGENGFIEWYSKKYDENKHRNSWTTPFLDKANQDEKAALELYFKYLEEYRNTNAQLP